MDYSEITYKAFCKDQKSVVNWLYNEYAKKLHGYTTRTYGMNEDDSWNVVYKTLYKVAECGKDYRFDHVKKLTGFIFKTHINYLRNFFRDQKSFESNHQEIDLEAETIKSDTELVQIDSSLMQKLRHELEVLEDWQRILLLMRSQGASYSAISKFVNKPEKHLKVYYARLKKQISDKMIEYSQTMKGDEDEK